MSATGHVSGVVQDIIIVSWEENESRVDDHGHQSDENTISEYNDERANVVHINRHEALPTYVCN